MGVKKPLGRPQIGHTRKISLTLTSEVWEQLGKMQMDRNMKLSEILRMVITDGLEPLLFDAEGVGGSVAPPELITSLSGEDIPITQQVINNSKKKSRNKSNQKDGKTIIKTLL